MKSILIIHYIIGISAILLVLASAYYINQYPENIISAGIIGFAASLVAISQFVIIKNKKK